MSSHVEVVFDTKDDHLVSDLYRGSITAVPSALDIELYVWGCAHQTSDWIVFNWRERQWRVVETVSRENAPSARHAHTATYFGMLGESYIAVLGGAARSPTDANPPFADVHIYDIKQRIWLPIPLPSVSQRNIEALTPRLFHSATFIEIEHNPYLIVVGGIFSDRTLAPNVPMPTMVNRRALVLPELRFYNLRLRCWSQPIYVPGRYRHSAILVPSAAREPKLMIIGGRDMKGNLANTALLIDVRGAFQTLKVPLNERPPTDDHGQGVYWSWLAGIVQPLGPYYGNCHVVSHMDSVVIFALPDRTSSQSSTQPARPERPRGSNPFRGPLPARSQPETRPRPPDASADAQAGYAAWALSFTGGSTSFRDLRKLRRTSQKAEAAAQSILAASLHDSVPSTSNAVPPAQNPPPLAHLPTTPQSEWLWCGVVQSGWGTKIGGQEDLLLLMYQTAGRVFLIPVLLSALGIPRERSDRAELASVPGAVSGLLCLLPSLWDGIPRMPMDTNLDPTIPPFADFVLHTSTPNAPPLILHRSILLARSSYFQDLLTSGFSESRTGEITVEESYPAAYALCHWIYTASLPAWLEAPNAFLRDDNFEMSFSTEGHYAAHAGETLCELLIAANARMLPTLANRVRHLLRAEHMHIPELAPLIWRASELTDVHDVEELVQFSSSSVIDDRMISAVARDCRPCFSPPRPASPRINHLNMLSIQVMGGGHRPPRVFEVPELLSLICSFSRISDCAHLAQTSRAVFRIAAAFVWQHVDGAQHLLSLLSGTWIIDSTKTGGTRKYAIGMSSDVVDFARFDLYAPYVRRLSVYEDSRYYRVSGWGALILRASAQQKPLLPNLLSIMIQTTCNSHCSDQVMWIKAFVSPSVLSIQILPTASMTATPPQISPLAASVVLDIISERCSRLLKLSFFVSSRAVTDKHDGENNLLCFLWKRPYHEYLRIVPTLSELTCSIEMLEPDSLRIIGALPFLRRLVVHSQERVVLRPPALSSNSFRSLRELCIKGVDPYEVGTILRIQSMMKGLTALDLELDLDCLDEDENREEWLTGNLLVSLSSAPKLAAFNLNVDPGFNLDDPYNIGDQDVMDTFSKLPLISLTLTGVHISEWASTGSLATVWPLVTSLRMVNQFASPLILSCFARLQHLRHLTLNIFLEDFIPCPKMSNISSLHTLEISPGGFTVCEPEHLEYTGRFLMSLFPALRRVVWMGYPSETPEQVSQRRFIGFLNQHMALRREINMLRTPAK